ncbi:hypothetical protein [Nonomuraea sp. NPDC049400]|uniref:hypothetical protein n=1 Tax=Nonomuraea sp. NPDC049400 TaxID=3364352 RepID=UPI0037B565C6
MTTSTSPPSAGASEAALNAYVQEAWTQADQARVEHLRRCLVHAVQVIRRHLPDARWIWADFSAAAGIGEAHAHVPVVRITHPAGVWDPASDSNTPDLPKEALNTVERLLGEALDFNVGDLELEEAGWKRDDDDDTYAIALPAGTFLPPPPDAVPAWVLNQHTVLPHRDTVSLHATSAAAFDDLAAAVRDRWSLVGSLPGVDLPPRPPLDVHRMVEAFFAAAGPQERFRLQPVLLPRLVAAALAETTVWVLLHGFNVIQDAEAAVFTSEKEALSSLAEEVRVRWSYAAESDLAAAYGVPDEPPEDDQAAVQLYFAVQRAEDSEERYSIVDRQVPGPLALIPMRGQ